MLQISVVICAFTSERWSALEAAVASVQSQAPPAHEIVVVIDHEPDLLERCRRRWPQLVVLASEHPPGLSGARNTGVTASRGEVVAFLDDDAVAQPRWLQTLARGYADPAVIGVGGSVHPHFADRRPAWFPPEFDWVIGCSHSGMPRAAAAVRNLIGANMSFRSELLAELGGFRADLGRVGRRPLGCEETDLCIRALQRRRHAVILYDPEARVLHEVPPARVGVRYFVARCAGEGRSKSLLRATVGGHDALSSERAYVRRTLPAGIAAGMRDGAAGTASGLARAGAIGLGLAATSAGYALGELRRVAARRDRRAAPRDPSTAAPPDRAGGGLRVLFVTPRYAPQTGGVERHVAEVARRVAAAGCDVTVLTTDRRGRLPAAERRDGVDVRRVRAWPAHGDLHLAPAIARVIASGRWDVVHVQSYHTLVAPLAMLAAWRCGLPYVVTFHGGGHSSVLRTRLRVVQRRLLRPLLARAARLVAVARFEVALYGHELGISPEQFVVIPNGADLPFTDGGEPANGTLIASVGRLERYKGHQRVIAALPHLIERRPDARLWIIGSGPYERALRRLATRLGVADRVEIRAVPEGDRGAMARGLRSASLVVLLSDFETHPLAALEAAYLGRPLVVADSSGLGELARDGLARAIAPRSAPQLVASAMLEQLERPLSVPAVELPTWDDCASRLLGVYREVAGRAACES